MKNNRLLFYQFAFPPAQNRKIDLSKRCDITQVSKCDGIVKHLERKFFFHGNYFHRNFERSAINYPGATMTGVHVTVRHPLHPGGGEKNNNTTTTTTVAAQRHANLSSKASALCHRHEL